MHKARRFFLLLFFLTLVVHANAQNQSFICSDSVINETSEVLATQELEYRKLKNNLYSLGGDDLTMRDPDSDYFVATITPRGLPLIPVEESLIVLVGKVTKIQTFLSEDKSQIYTEITVQVEEILKNSSQSEIGTSIILDKIGGSILLSSGKILRHEVKVERLGNVCENNRYVFFIQQEGEVYYYIKYYELNEGKVFIIEGSERKVISEKYKDTKGIEYESVFLDLIRGMVRTSMQ